MAQRLTRAARRERTREDLLAAGRDAFLRRGFHGASLDQIADEAGYSKGAVYSNFASKDDLFLAILRAHFEERLGAYRAITLEGERLEDVYRAVAGFMYDADRREPEWGPLLLEFWAHASRREPLRGAVAALRDGFLEGIADLIATTVARHGAELVLPPLEVARASGGLMRGVGVEWLLEPATASRDAFQTMHVALMSGLTRERGKG